jgi:hypothetical protein
VKNREGGRMMKTAENFLTRRYRKKYNIYNGLVKTTLEYIHRPATLQIKARNFSPQPFLAEDVSCGSLIGEKSLWRVFFSELCILILILIFSLS